MAAAVVAHRGKVIRGFPINENTVHTVSDKSLMERTDAHNCCPDFSSTFRLQRLRIWQAVRRYLLIAPLFFLVACSPSNHTEFSASFELSSFLKDHVFKLPGQVVRFQILDSEGEPIPYDLLRFEWVEGGWMSFQTDQDGTLSMQFEKDMLENEVIVSAKSKRAKIRVIW